MNITSAQYVSMDGENVSVTIMVDDERISVPINASGNRHWEAILEWTKEDGNEIQAAE